MSFPALLVRKEGKKQAPAQLVTLSEKELPAGDTTVAVEASTVNYKDGLALGGKGIIRKYPMVPGIDLAGTVLESSAAGLAKGTRVVLNGYGASEGMWGGYAGRWRGAGKLLVPLPAGISAEEAMAIGTGGYTAMLCVMALERAGVQPGSGTVLVTGACGGVGTVSIALLSKLGYRVAACTGRESERPFLESLGAAEIVPRAELEKKGGPLGKERWAGVVDAVGGGILANAITQTKYLGAVAACGMAAGTALPASVLPFILRGVQLVGVDSVQAPMARRVEAWRRLDRDLDRAKLRSLTTSAPLADVPRLGTEILQGTVRGRVVVTIPAKL